jgi:nitrate/nitrite transporter NarK
MSETFAIFSGRHWRIGGIFAVLVAIQVLLFAYADTLPFERATAVLLGLGGGLLYEGWRGAFPVKATEEGSMA